MKYLINSPHISKLEKKYVLNALNSGWLSVNGKNTKEFEKKISKFLNINYSLAVQSGTAAIHLALKSLGCKANQNVIVPNYTCVSNISAVSQCGAIPIIVEIERDTLGIDLKQLKIAIKKYKPKILQLVHVYGCPAKNTMEIVKVCKKNKIKLIEDCAHSIGTKYNSRHVGLFGMTGCFSFYPTKQITTGEGGMVITNDKAVYKKIKMLKAFGIDKDINNRKKPGHYDVKLLGLNYRMTDFQSAMGYAQILRYKKNLIKRKSNAKIYYKFLKKIKNINFDEYSNDCSYFIFQIFKKKRDKLIKALKKNGVGFSIHYAKSLPLMTYYKKKYNYSVTNFKNALSYSKENISLPVYPGLKRFQISRICKILKDTLN